jgi:alanine or glycine:cation symporter, AGCS family
MNFIHVLNVVNVYLYNTTGFLLFFTALLFTLATRLIQLRAIPLFFKLIIGGVQKKSQGTSNSINSLYALFTAMSTSMGMGTIVSPSIAIVVGGPGALVWLIVFALIGSVIKFVEVTCGIRFRTTTKDGKILGGPMQYLHKVTPWLGAWYAYATIFLFTCWSALQANVLAETLYYENVPVWVTGLLLSLLVYIMLLGGAQRIGEFNSKLVPIMFTLYVSTALYIIITNLGAAHAALATLFTHLFSPAPALGGFAGASSWLAFQCGIHRGALITESGVGTAAIPHSMADVKKPTDQAVLAMTSVWADTFLCFLSGMLVLISGVWKDGIVCNTMVYQTFMLFVPQWGRFILISCIVMFVTGTIIGNSFNGRQSYAAVTRYGHLYWYYGLVCGAIFLGSMANVPLIWALADSVLPFVVIPHIVGLLYLFYNHRQEFNI